MTKKMTSYRINTFTEKALGYIAEKLGTTKTEAIEDLIRDAILNETKMISTEGKLIQLSYKEFKDEYLPDKSSD